MPPSIGKSVKRRRSASPRMRLSSVDRSTAIATPKANPTQSPKSRFSLVLGADGATGASAGLMTDRLTGEAPPDLGFSRLSTARIKLSATACAIAADRTGEPSVAVIFISTVLMSVLALTRPANSADVVFNPNESMAGCKTIGESTVLTYDCTLAWLNVFPCWSSCTEPEP